MAKNYFKHKFGFALTIRDIAWVWWGALFSMFMFSTGVTILRASTQIENFSVVQSIKGIVVGEEGAPLHGACRGDREMEWAREKCKSIDQKSGRNYTKCGLCLFHRSDINGCGSKRLPPF